MNQDGLFGDPAGTLAPGRRPRREHPAQHLESRSPRGIRAVWCGRCGAPILRGLDEDLGAFTTYADPAPLTALGEAVAWLDGRRTVELRKIAGTPQLMRRNRYTIASRPPGSRIWCGRIDVLAEHRCHAQPLPTQPTVHPPKPDTEEASRNAPPPF